MKKRLIHGRFGTQVRHAGLFALAWAAMTAFVAGQEPVAGIAGVPVRLPLESKIVTSAPYSAEIINESTQTLADGNRIVQRTIGKVFRDSEGRVRREDKRGPDGMLIVSIVDPVAGVSYSLLAESRIALQTPAQLAAVSAKKVSGDTLSIARGDLRYHWDAGSVTIAGESAHSTRGVVLQGRLGPMHGEGPVTTERLSGRLVEGIWAEGTRRTTTIETGAIGNERPIAIVSEEWVSPELQVLVATEHSDPRLGTSTYQLTNIQRSEPAHSLFEVPGDYTIKQVGLVPHERLQGEK